MILPWVFVPISIMQLNSTWGNIATQNAWQLLVHCVLFDIWVFVEKLKFTVKMKVWLISHGYWRNIELNWTKIVSNRLNSDQLDSLNVKKKIHWMNPLLLFIGIILGNLIWHCILWLTLKLIMHKFSGSIF